LLLVFDETENSADLALHKVNFDHGFV